MAKHRTHPVMRWCETQGKTLDDLAVLIRARGRECSTLYLEHIFRYCYHEPGRRLEEVVHEITGVPVVEIRGYPYKERRAA